MCQVDKKWKVSIITRGQGNRKDLARPNSFAQSDATPLKMRETPMMIRERVASKSNWTNEWLNVCKEKKEYRNIKYTNRYRFTKIVVMKI